MSPFFGASVCIDEVVTGVDTVLLMGVAEESTVVEAGLGWQAERKIAGNIRETASVF
jgi:hypothetical protein